MTFEPIIDNVDQAQARMVKRWKDKDNVDKVIKIRVNRIQAIEDILDNLANERAISTASGVQLNGLGEFYGEQGARSNRSDDEYRSYLQILPAKLRQAGQHEILVQAYKNLTGASKINTDYFFPRALALYAIIDDVDSLTNEEEINNEMQAIRAQGIRLDLGTQQTIENFVFSLTADGGVPANSGFATLADGSDGGKFIKLIGK